MSRDRALGVLSGESAEAAFAMTWAPPEALQVLTWQAGVDNAPDTLAAVAAAFSLDLACVVAGEEWAPEALSRLAEEDVAGGWIVSGPFGRVADKRGWSEVLALSAAGPGELAIALDQELHETLEQVRLGREAGADVLVCADELAGAAGWLVSPDFALEALMPSYKRIAREWGDAGPAVFHSDGDIRALMPALAAAGFDAVHFGSAGPATLSLLVEAARAAGLCPVGGIPAQALVAEGARHTGRVAAGLAAGGRIVFADDGGMSLGEEFSAFGAAIDAARGVLGIEK